MASFGNEPNGRPVYAKLVGENVVFYMYKFSATLGRGTRGDETADFLVSTDNVISRLHARIYYSLMEQGFELEVLGKNGVYVNGRFITKKDKPILLHSQAEIVLGKQKPVMLTFLLPAANTTQMDKKKVRYKSHADQFNLVNMIGSTLVNAGESGINVQELSEKMWTEIMAESEGRNPYQSKDILFNGVRHVLAISSYFAPSSVLTDNTRGWVVRAEHKKRFSDPLFDNKMNRGVTVMSTDTANKRQRIGS